MAPNERARQNHGALFPNHVSALATTDPELIDIFDNFAFDEVLQGSTLGVRTRLDGVRGPRRSAHAVDEGHGAATMEITKSGSQASAKGPADWFTGSVRIDSPFQRPAPGRVGGATVTFQPGARTAWHTHPLAQTLIVTLGCGRVQRDGGPIQEIRAGGIVLFEPREWHWHGASPTTAMTHIAIAEMRDGKTVEWMEHVTDEQYGG